MEHNNNEKKNDIMKDLFNNGIFKNMLNEVLGKANNGQKLNNSILKNAANDFNSSVISKVFNLLKDIINITNSNHSSTKTYNLTKENNNKNNINESLIYKNISNDYSSEIITNHIKNNSTNEIISHIINNYNTNDIKTYFTYNNSINESITHNIKNHSVNESIAYHINNHSMNENKTHNYNNHDKHHIKIQNQTKNNILINKNINNYSDDSNISTILGIGLPILISIFLILIYFIKIKIKKIFSKDKKNLDKIQIKNSGSKMSQKEIQNTSSLNILDPDNNISMNDIKILNMKNDLNSILSRRSVDSLSSSGQRKKQTKKNNKEKVKNIIGQDQVSQEKAKNELNEEIKQYVIDEKNNK